jgi:hypothetical protein
MLRLLSSLLVLIACVGGLSASEIKGKITKISTEKNTITVTVDDKDQTYSVDKEAKFVVRGKKKSVQDVEGGLSGLTTGSDATITLENKDGKDVVTRVEVDRKKKKK